MPTRGPWRRGLEILNLRTSNKNLDFMQVRNETLRVDPLEVGLRDLPVSGLGVRKMLDLYFYFLAKTKYSLDNLY